MMIKHEITDWIDEPQFGTFRTDYVICVVNNVEVHVAYYPDEKKWEARSALFSEYDVVLSGVENLHQAKLRTLSLLYHVLQDLANASLEKLVAEVNITWE